MIKFLRWLRKVWRQRQRDADHECLFGPIRSAARDRAHFLEAAKLHILTDEAWNVDYDELSERDRALHDEIFGAG